MVVLAAAVVTKTGKPLIERSFIPSFSRSRLEGLLVSFPKQIPPDAQHTTALSSDGSVRYAWSVIDDLYTVLITPPHSNILLDLSTLALITRVVSETLTTIPSSGSREVDVIRHSFDILSSFDEVVSLGYRERVNMSDVRAAMEMESYEERIQEIIAKNKEQEAKEELKRRAKQLEMQRREMARRGQNPYAANSSPMPQFERPNYAPTTTTPATSTSPDPSTSGSGGGTTLSTLKKPAFKKQGMQLGGSKGKGQKADFMDALAGQVEDSSTSAISSPAVRQESIDSQTTPSTRSRPLANVATPKVENPFPPVAQESVHLALREKLALELSRDGGLNSFELKGELDLRVTDAAVSKIMIAVQNDPQGLGNDVQFKTHPNVDKSVWAESRKISLKDRSKGFPVGQALGVLKWRSSTKDETLVPLSISCWPSPSDNGTCDVNIEYELENDTISLHNVVISIPLPESEEPVINSVDGEYFYDEDSHSLEWTIPQVSSTNAKSGNFEFQLQAHVPSPEELGGASVSDVLSEQFFPLTVEFASQQGLSGVQVGTVESAESSSPVTFSSERLLTTDKYHVA